MAEHRSDDRMTAWIIAAALPVRVTIKPKEEMVDPTAMLLDASTIAKATPKAEGVRLKGHKPEATANIGVAAMLRLCTCSYSAACLAVAICSGHQFRLSVSSLPGF